MALFRAKAVLDELIGGRGQGPGSQGPGSGPTFVHDFSLGHLYLQQVALYQIPILLDSLPLSSPYLPGVTPITRRNMAMKALTLS